MALSLRDPEAGKLARELATLRNTNMTEAILSALRNELRREREKQPLQQRLAELADKALAMGRTGGRVMTKDEIDTLWGQ